MKNAIHIYTQNVRFPIAPEFYGLFFEDINHAADGGLYPEMIRNRAFEDSILPEGCTTDPNEKIFVTEYGWPGAFNHGEGMDEWADAVMPTEIPGWYSVDASLTLLRKGTLNSNRKAALQVSFIAGGKIYNIGYSGVPVEKGDKYNLYFMLKSDADVSFIASLESEDGASLGRCNIAVQQSSGYRRYDCELTAVDTDFKGRFSLCCDSDCTVTLGFISLMPEKTFKGHGLREDLAMMLKNTHAKFIRFPGGCVVEGINEQNALSFSRTIGPVWERPSSQLMWHYRTTNGLGFHEFLQLCEDLEMEAMYVCNCGMSCQARHGGGFSDEETKKYLEEALNALEYALGSVDTPFGSLRAKNGRKEPFRLKYVEIGNENFGLEYNVRYEMFYKTLKKAFPQVIYISNGHTERSSLPTDYVDEHYYNAPEFFLENGDLFDDYDRKGPKIFLGEYAVNGGNTIASMECALAEAAFLLGAERNQDIVRLTAYAPLFQNSDYTAWKPNLIVFDNHQVYGIPSYHAISLLGKYRGDEVVEVVNDSKEIPPVYCGISGIMSEKEGLVFKNAKINGTSVDVPKCIYGEIQKAEDGWKMVSGNRKHHFTGKSKEWNEAFEEFIEGGNAYQNTIMWAVFETEEMKEYTFEVDIKGKEDIPLTLSIWNHHPETDAGCNEPKDNEWTPRGVRNQVWRIEHGKSMVRVPRLFDKPLSEEEQVQISINYEEYNHYKIVCDTYGYKCYINGQLIQEKVHKLHPLIHTIATQDKKQIYVKLVNISEKDEDVRITVDCEVNESIITEVLAAKPWEVNSFENKEQVSVVNRVISGGRDFVYRAPAHSVNVLIMKKQSAYE